MLLYRRDDCLFTFFSQRGILSPAHPGETHAGDYARIRCRKSRSAAALGLSTGLSALGRAGSPHLLHGAPRPRAFHWTADTLPAPSLVSPAEAALASYPSPPPRTLPPFSFHRFPPSLPPLPPSLSPYPGHATASPAHPRLPRHPFVTAPLARPVTSWQGARGGSGRTLTISRPRQRNRP